MGFREAPHLHRTVVRNMSEGVCLVRVADRTIAWANPRFEEMFGHHRGQLTGRPAAVLGCEPWTCPIDSPTRAAVDRLAGEESVLFDVRGVRYDGRAVWTQARITRFNHPVHGPVWSAVHQEIAPSAVAAEQVMRMLGETERLVEQRFLAEAGLALADSLDPEVALDRAARVAVPAVADGSVVYLAGGGGVAPVTVRCATEERAAAVWESLRRLPIDAQHGAGRVAATGVPDLVPDLDRPALRGARGDEHVALLRRAGITSYVTVPLRGRAAVIGALTLFMTDSGRHVTASDVPLIEELGRRAALAIENAQLCAAARRATRERDDVLAVVAHDLRNPINAILLTLKALRRDPAFAREGAPAWHSVVTRAAERMNRMLGDILDYARIENGQLRVHVAPAAPAALVGEAVEASAPLARDREIAIRVELGEALPDVLADRDRVLQVLSNLIENALKFTPSGEVVVAVEAGAEGVHFRVRDTGPGIAAADLPHVFERYFQGGREGGHGLGLGLAICEAIVTASGGRIWAESTAAGSTFHFTLPAAAAELSEGLIPPSLDESSNYVRTSA